MIRLPVRCRTSLALAACAAFLTSAPTVYAGPGAHGPNGEHLDAAPGAAVADTSPRVEASSELFELVARLENGRLHAFLDAYETNAPVLDASIEVETGGVKAAGKLDPARGDYVFDDAKLIAALSADGDHALVFTVTTKDDGDLLEGKLIAPADAHDHEHASARWAWLAGGGLIALLGGAFGYRAWRARRESVGAAGAAA
jgi:hypothetical protein